jgi:hypothetical protein
MIVQTCCSSLLEEVYTEDERKPEWFEVDRAIACRQKYDIDGPCDILATFQNNEDFDGYEFLVKWNDLDYGECTWEPYCTEGVPSAVSMLIERHQNTLKRVDRVNETCMDGKLPDKVHNGVLYGYQLQGLQWIFQNFITRRSVILAGMFMSPKPKMQDALVFLTIIAFHLQSICHTLLGEFLNKFMCGNIMVLNIINIIFKVLLSKKIGTFDFSQTPSYD